MKEKLLKVLSGIGITIFIIVGFFIAFIRVAPGDNPSATTKIIYIIGKILDFPIYMYNNIMLIVVYLAIIGFVIYGIFIGGSKVISFFALYSKRSISENRLKIKIPFFWYAIIVSVSSFLIYWVSRSLIIAIVKNTNIPVIFFLITDTLLVIAYSVVPLVLIKKRHDKILQKAEFEITYSYESVTPEEFEAVVSAGDTAQTQEESDAAQMKAINELIHNKARAMAGNNNYQTFPTSE